MIFVLQIGQDQFHPFTLIMLDIQIQIHSLALFVLQIVPDEFNPSTAD